MHSAALGGYVRMNMFDHAADSAEFSSSSNNG